MTHRFFDVGHGAFIFAVKMQNQLSRQKNFHRGSQFECAKNYELFCYFHLCLPINHFFLYQIAFPLSLVLFLFLFFLFLSLSFSFSINLPYFCLSSHPTFFSHILSHSQQLFHLILSPNISFFERRTKSDVYIRMISKKCFLKKKV